ncbi:hypothetical protein [Buchnera aphidicola]
MDANVFDFFLKNNNKIFNHVKNTLNIINNLERSFQKLSDKELKKKLFFLKKV